jgi:hypothetical protein
MIDHHPSKACAPYQGGYPGRTQGAHALLAPLYRQGAVGMDHLPFACNFMVHPARAAVYELLYTLT